MKNPQQSGTAAFGRTDLLATMAAVAVLLGLAVPALGRTDSRSRSQVCLDNLRSLIRATLVYAADHRDEFPMVTHGGDAQAGTQIDYASPRSLRPWATGWLSWGTEPANTNTAFLVSSRYAVLGDYTRDPALYKCPSDTFRSSLQRARGWKARVRSYSANLVVGGGNKSANDGLINAEKLFLRTTDVDRPTPSNLIIFLEEHPDSINDGAFVSNQGNRQWIDVPASNHPAGATNSAANFSFADGHVESHVWIDSVLREPVNFLYSSPPVRTGDPDFAWVLDRLSYNPRAAR